MLLLCLLWIVGGEDLAGLLLVLSLLILMLARWRFPRLKWTLLLDQLLIFAVAETWEMGAYGLVLSVFEGAYLLYPLLIIPASVYAILYQPDIYLLALLVQALLCGFFLRGWHNQQQNSLRQMDNDSKRYYELESLKQDLLAANKQVAQMAELSERSRIARDIHDYAGHEIVAAYLSLQTVEVLMEQEPEQARSMLGESMERLETGIENIRQAVHNLAPLADVGIASLRKLCEEFVTHCPVEFNSYGDASKVPVYHWVILEPCLKEALTNIMRHSQARQIRVTLDITSHIVRLCVENDGVTDRSNASPGLGLRNLQQRAKSVDGNVSVDITDEFRLVCVLPIHRKGGA